jgi:hypothetical protein
MSADLQVGEDELPDVVGPRRPAQQRLVTDPGGGSSSQSIIIIIIIIIIVIIIAIIIIVIIIVMLLQSPVISHPRIGQIDTSHACHPITVYLRVAHLFLLSGRRPGSLAAARGRYPGPTHTARRHSAHRPWPSACTVEIRYCWHEGSEHPSGEVKPGSCRAVTIGRCTVVGRRATRAKWTCCYTP